MIMCVRLLLAGGVYKVVSGGHTLYRLDLEVQADQREHQTLEILDKVVEAPESIRILALVDINQ